MPLLGTNLVNHHGVSQSLLVIPVCLRGSKSIVPYAYRDRWYPFMHTGIRCHAIPGCIWGSRSIPVCIWGYQRSPYAYRDYMTHNPRMHMGIKINPRMHTGITEIPICIRVSHDTNPRPYAYGDISVTNHMYRGNISIWEIKSCIPSCIISHTGIAICTWGLQYANG